MTPKKLLLIFFICLIPFLFYFLKPEMVGFDSYAFVNLVCFSQPLNNLLPGAELVFSVLPCNFLFFKLLLFAVFFSCTVVLALIGELFEKERGWLISLFVLTAPIYFSHFLWFEDDFLAFPFLFLGLYFSLKGVMNKDFKAQFVGFVLIVFAGLFWQGAIFYLIAVGLLTVFPLLFVVPILLVKWNNFVYAFTPSLVISENFPVFGFLLNGVLLIGFVKLPKWLLLPTIFLTVLALLNSKFAFLLVPFLCIGFIRLIGLAFNEMKGKEKGLFYLILVFMVLVSLVSLSATVMYAEPTSVEFDAIDFAVEKANDLNKSFVNEWSFGYWVKFKGIDTNFFESGSGVIDCNASICLTKFEQPCVLLKEFNRLKVYDCN